MSDEVTDFERDAISFVLELGQKCGLKPQEAFQRLGPMRHRLSELRTKWIEELDVVLTHARRERDDQKTRADKLTNAIDLALIALDPVADPTVSEAEKILERAIGRRNGQETPGETP